MKNQKDRIQVAESSINQHSSELTVVDNGKIFRFLFFSSHQVRIFRRASLYLVMAETALINAKCDLYAS